jgi:hypothetical protein
MPTRMNMQNIVPVKILFTACLLLLSAVPVRSQVGSWESLPSLTQIRDLSPYGEDILLGTDGGVISFSKLDLKFENGVDGQQTRNLDVNTIQVQNDGLLWIGSRSPGPIVEVIDLMGGDHLDVEFVDLDEVTSFAQACDSVYATFRDGIDGGLLLYRKNNVEIEYLDLFNNFPSQTSLDLSKISDVTLIDDKIVFRTDKHLLWAARSGANLKDPANWTVRPIPSGDIKTIKLLAYDGGALLAVDSKIYAFDFNQFTLLYESSATLIDMQISSLDPPVLHFASSGGLFELNLGSSVSDRLLHRSGIQQFVSVDADIWLAHNMDFLGNINQDSYTSYSANRPRDHLFNQMIINEAGELIATAANGISIHSSQGWRTIKAGQTSSTFDPNGYDWNRLITDTLPYGGHYIVEDMISDKAGNLYLSIQGRGILKLGQDLPQDFAFYNASDGTMEPTFDSQTYVLTTQMAVDGSNNVWTTTKFIRDGGHAITIFSEDGSIHHIDQDVNGLNTRSAKSIAIDKNDMVWVGSQVITDGIQSAGGIHLIHRTENNNGVWEYEFASLIGVPPLASNEILQLEVDQQNVLWILTPSGVQSMPLPDTFKTTNELRNWANLYMTAKGSDDYTYWQLTDYNVTRMEVDSRGNHWFLSSNAGVHVLQANGRWINGGFGYNSGNSPLLDNEVYSLAFDASTGETYLSTPKGISILHTPFATPKESYSSIHVYPQPFNPDIHSRVIIQGLMDNSSVKILTVAGEMIKELNSENAMVQGFEAQWDGRDDAGDKVGSGVYLLYFYNEDGAASTYKLAILR